jgi:hypothetical protein
MLALGHFAEIEISRTEIETGSAPRIGASGTFASLRETSAASLRQPPLDHFLQLVDVHRLAEVIIHPGGAAQFLVALHRVGRRGDDARLA